MLSGCACTPTYVKSVQLLANTMTAAACIHPPGNRSLARILQPRRMDRVEIRGQIELAVPTFDYHGTVVRRSGVLSEAIVMGMPNR